MVTEFQVPYEGRFSTNFRILWDNVVPWS